MEILVKSKEKLKCLEESTDVSIQPILRETGLFHCPSCNQGFKQRSNAQSHYKSVHLDIKSQCTDCGKYFRKLKAHIRDVHLKKNRVTCSICKKEYHEGRLFKDHLNKTHFQDLDGNPYVKHLVTKECDICGIMVMKSRFERHMKMKHYSSTGFSVECPLCGAHVKYLPLHLQKLHKDTDCSKTMKKCNQCSQWFINNEEFAKHMVKHEKYCCMDCFQTFDSQSKFAEHKYSAHNESNNTGRFTQSQMIKPFATSVTYLIDKAQVVDKVEILSTVNSIGNRTKLHVPEYDECSFLADEVVEESFTVVLDSGGNLQHLMVDQLDSNVKSESVVLKTSTTSSLEVNKIEESQNIDIQYVEGDEYGVKLNENSECIKVLIPSNGKNISYPNTFSLKPSEDQTTIGVTESFKESKLHERFMIEKKFLPRSLVGVQLSSEDEKLLNDAPSIDKCDSKHLLKYQIGKNVETTSTSNRYQACPSRQAHLCPYCRKILKTRHSLKMHISVVHLQTKRISCNICSKSFATKSDFIKHQKTKHDEASNTMVKCDICDESFRMNYLKRHKYYKHPPKTLLKKCEECGKEFKSREIMLKHCKKIHKKLK